MFEFKSLYVFHNVCLSCYYSSVFATSCCIIYTKDFIALKCYIQTYTSNAEPTNGTEQM